MADANGAGSTAVVAIVVLVIIAIVALFYFLTDMGTGRSGDVNINPQIESPIPSNISPSR